MSAFANGGGTLKSTNKPAALFELATLLNDVERAASTTDDPIENITMAVDLEARVANISAALPITPSVDGAGNSIITAVNYLPGSVFNIGAAGDLKKANYPGAFLELALTVAAAEAAVAPTPENNVTIAFDLEDRSATVTISLPIVPTIDGTGKMTVSATDYLP